MVFHDSTPLLTQVSFPIVYLKFGVSELGLSFGSSLASTPTVLHPKLTRGGAGDPSWFCASIPRSHSLGSARGCYTPRICPSWYLARSFGTLWSWHYILHGMMATWVTNRWGSHWLGLKILCRLEDQWRWSAPRGWWIQMVFWCLPRIFKIPWRRVLDFYVSFQRQYPAWWTGHTC